MFFTFNFILIYRDFHFIFSYILYFKKENFNFSSMITFCYFSQYNDVCCSKCKVADKNTVCAGSFVNDCKKARYCSYPFFGTKKNLENK